MDIKPRDIGYDEACDEVTKLYDTIRLVQDKGIGLILQIQMMKLILQKYYSEGYVKGCQDTEISIRKRILEPEVN